MLHWSESATNDHKAALWLASYIVNCTCGHPVINNHVEIASHANAYTYVAIQKF